MPYQCGQCHKTLGPVTTLAWCPNTRRVATLLESDTGQPVGLPLGLPAAATNQEHVPAENVGHRGDQRAP